jgi:hypothetical protein
MLLLLSSSHHLHTTLVEIQLHLQAALTVNQHSTPLHITTNTPQSATIMLAPLITLLGLSATTLSSPTPSANSLVSVKLFPNANCTGPVRILNLVAEDQCYTLGGANGLEVVFHAESLRYNSRK